MATTTFLANATCNITPTGGSIIDVSDQLSKCEVTVGYDILDSTSLNDTGHQGTNGLQTVSVNLDLFLSYGVGEIETLLAAIVAAGSCTIVVSPSGTSETASNPEYTITKQHFRALQSSCQLWAPLQLHLCRSSMAPGHETSHRK